MCSQKYTHSPNMAAWFYAQLNDVTAPHEFVANVEFSSGFK